MPTTAKPATRSHAARAISAGALGTGRIRGDALPRPARRAGRAEPRSHTALLSRYRTIVLLVDVASGSVAGLLSLGVRFGSEATTSYRLLSVLAPLLWLASVAARRGYERRALGDGPEEYRRLVDSCLVLFILAASVSFTVRGELSRGYLSLVLPTALVLSLTGRRFARIWLRRRHRVGDGVQRVLVVGPADQAAHVIEQLDREPWHGLFPVGVCAAGDVEAVLAAVEANRADAVAVTAHPDLSGHALRRLAWALDEREIDLIVSPGIVEVAGPRLSIRPAAGLSLLYLDRPAINGARMIFKALLDRLLALLLLVAALPLMAAVALAIATTSRGPVLFRQQRIGAGGRPFQMLKFRSMVVDAEQRLAEVAALNESDSVMFKIRRDPRVTTVGAVIRRHSLDELPQLWNVLRGEMSLVGPRPPLPSEVDAYDSDAFRRLRVRPGMTGLWQVSGRSDLSWEESLRLDLRYVDNWCLALDLQILWRTWHAVIGRSGAY